MKDETPVEETDPAILALENRRLNRRRRSIEANTVGTKEHTPDNTADHPRLTHQLAETPQPDRNTNERPFRTIRWQLPGKLLTILALLLLLTMAYQLFTGKNSTTLDTVETGNATSATPITQEKTENTDPPAHQKTGTVWVHVAGAVTSPGVYELSAHARIADAVTAAGGARDDADLNLINLAAHVTDGSQIYIPVTGESPPSTPTPPAAEATTKPGPQASDQLINLNTANQSELETLPRVGPVLAQKIIEWREANGGFTSVAELDAVPGIGPAMMETLTPLVTV